MRSAASGDVVYFKIGLRRSYLITSLSDIRHALQDQRPQLPQESANYRKSQLRTSSLRRHC
jgi:hypothetical protein